ncbi:MAG: phenylacetate--CoA ligase family protein [Oscillospiraceae bacterium]|nr:phenylacetate--CoA ligase family protein [Oscillospiraceae bacterium]
MLRVSPIENWIFQRTGARNLTELREYQLGKLKETFDYAKSRSRFYRRYLSGIESADITCLDDLSAVPFTTGEMISQAPNDFLCVSPGDIERIVTLPTSGTTGTPKRIFFTKDDQELTIDFFHHGMNTLVGQGDRVILFLPGASEGGVGDLLARGLKRLGCQSDIFGPVDDYAAAGSAILEGGYDCAVGLPAQLFAISKLFGDINLKSILLCSDYTAGSLARSLADSWGCDVYSHYGMIESGLGGGVECAAHAGYHMREADLLFEVVDPVSGKPVADGEYGELVFTTLTRRGMPLIRYRTDDISRVIPEPCPCGSVLRRFEPVGGRYGDMIRLGEGQGAPSHPMRRYDEERGVLSQSMRGNGERQDGLSQARRRHDEEQGVLSLPMIDDVLFGLPGLIGYEAEVINDADCGKLVIKVYSNDDDICNHVIDAINGDVRLSVIIRGSMIGLNVAHGGFEVLTYGNTKRRIAIRR